jgi:alkanesulfonate monooxygenase SsuD/methylene tetrahydromethanopterin reductase-like flavin-dependent oxidoreductase (luciferase family)
MDSEPLDAAGSRGPRVTGDAASDSDTSTGRLEAARRALGRVGVFLPHSMTTPTPVDEQREAVRRFERAGYRAAWVNEVPGKDALVQLAVLLAATEHLVFGTGIANIWVRPPHTTHAAAAQLAQAYPGRIVLGLGVGHPPQAAGVGADFGRPLATMRRYLERMDAPDPSQLPAPDAPYPRILGANGPKMLALATELTDGAMPAMVAPQITATARQALGPDKLLVVLIDASPTQGEPAAVAATVRAHHACGADHVVAGLPMGTDFAAGVHHLETLAPALTTIE